MMSEQADDLVGYLGGDREIVWCSTGRTTVDAEGADEEIEIAVWQSAAVVRVILKYITHI